MGVFTMLLDNAHITLLGPRTLCDRRKERSQSLSNSYPSGIHAPSLTTLYPKHATALRRTSLHLGHARADFGVELTPGEYFVALCAVGLTREGLVS
jgi:hypothetical protein